MAKKLTEEEWIRINHRTMTRQMAIDGLRDKHRLSMFEVMGIAAEEVRKRQRFYEEDLARLKEKWAKEDEAFNREYGLDEAEGK